MRPFLFKILVFGLLLLLFMTALDRLVTSGLKKTRQEYFRNWNEITDCDNPVSADLLVMGSSRARVQVSPRVLDSVLSVSSYVIGQDGSGVETHMAKYAIYRRCNKRPQWLIQVLDLNSFKRRDTLINHEQFMPYLAMPEMKKLTASKKGFSWLTYHFPFARYFGEWNFIRVGLLEALALRKYDFPGYYKGFEPKYKTWDEDSVLDNQINRDPVEHFFDSSLVTEYLDFARRLKKEGVRLLFVYPPHFQSMNRRVQSLQAIFTHMQSLADRCGAKFLNFATDPLGEERNNFYNATHMNAKASDVFSKKLAIVLKDGLREEYP